MRRFRRSYSSYRGRKTLHDILKLIVVVLVVLVMLMLAVLLFGQKYLVFSDRGLRLDIPFFQREGREPEPPGSISVVIEPAQSGETEEPEKPEEEETIRAMELPLAAVLDGSAAQQLKQAGANALILDMKNEEGRLSWTSGQPFALQAGVNSLETGVNDALTAWNGGGIYTVARVCCFRDNTIPYQRNDLALRAGYGNWRDELGLRWMNPDSEEARAYVAGLCAELAQMGFDEILLDCCAFPSQGNLDQIVAKGSYASGLFAQRTEGFLEEVRLGLEPYGAVLSVRADRAVFTGGDAVSGLTAQVLEEKAGRIWMKEDGEEPALSALLVQAGITRPEQRLVEEVTSLEGKEQSYCAVFDGK